ncbi:MAG: ATP-dependent helicase [Eubacterium sp.]|nr:ATP-dependent helicase [Eubacterium sp.]
MSRQFHEQQKKAISHGKGPAMVLAGPGSGKTTVITWRVRYLIEKAGVDPAHILVITFTRAAADEMKRRFFRFEGMDRSPVTFGTFHAVFFMILRYAYHYKAANIIREESKRQVIRDLAGSLDMEIEDENDFVSSLIGEISYVKGEMLSLPYYHSAVCSDEQFARIYKGYENYLRQEQLIDFDDMLVFCCELLRERKDILSVWQERFQYILIDEFQDINKVQYEIVKMLAGKEKNLFVVGDDDQSIYRFRGARPEIMLGFEKDFPGAAKITLGVNYRCSSQIVESSVNLIGHNKKRYSKDLKSHRGPVVPVTFKQLKDSSEECVDIIRGILYYQKKGISLEEMAVIYRTNTQPRLLVSRLMEYNIPFVMRDQIPNIFEHWIARNILTYIRIAQGDRTRSSFLQIMNKPKRYISRTMLTGKQVDLAELKRASFGKRWLFEKIDKLEMDLYLLRKMSPYEAVTYIRQGIGYEDYLAEYAGFRNMDLAGLIEILDQVHESARGFDTFEAWFDHIEAYGKALEKQRNRRQDRREGLTLTTMHSAKGLEYEVVFVIDVNEGITPHRKAVKDADLEEERRLFYVAMTRAKTYLFLYSLKELYKKNATVSRYIGELQADTATGPEDAGEGGRL